jgi:hypothetical protein
MLPCSLAPCTDNIGCDDCKKESKEEVEGEEEEEEEDGKEEEDIMDI